MKWEEIRIYPPSALQWQRAFFLSARFVMSVLRDYVNYIEVMWVLLATFLQPVICAHMIGSRRPAG